MVHLNKPMRSIKCEKRFPLILTCRVGETVMIGDELSMKMFGIREYIVRKSINVLNKSEKIGKK